MIPAEQFGNEFKAAPGMAPFFIGPCKINMIFYVTKGSVPTLTDRRR
jgi:hypothetical protein